MRRRDRDASRRSIGLLATVLWSAACLAASPSTAWAGGGPENVLLVVNVNSADSKTIANHYVAIRDIPASNVVYVNWRGGDEGCQGPQFWSKILRPTLDEIGERRLGEQIDYIVYSADIPWIVRLQPLFPDEKFSTAFRPIAATTGATFLWQYVRDKNPAIVAPVVNWYAAPDDGENDIRCERLGQIESRGFRARYGWDQAGQRTKDRTRGQSYFLSTMLGVTSGRGNTVAEIVRYLHRAAEADGTRPSGTIYFLKNNDIRSQTRHDCYDGVVQQLLTLGVSARVVPGRIPQGANDVLGIMAGTAKFDFAQSGSRILPGAICEHLTSLGGDLRSSAGQTPLTEFLRYGAAGASGTVTEPLALQYKFPLASLQLHYARGCSLAESFYQSVAGPYQLLIVGDPLCQPWAVAPAVTIEGIEPGQTVQGNLTISAKLETAPSRRVAMLEMFVDGRMVARYPPEHAPALDTTKLPDGYHELRVVAVAADAIETRGRAIVPIRVNNHGQEIEFTVEPRSGIVATEKVRISARQPGATAIVVRHNRREVARFKGDAGEVELLAATLGSGPVTLQAASEGPQQAVSRPVQIEIP